MEFYNILLFLMLLAFAQGKKHTLLFHLTPWYRIIVANSHLDAVCFPSFAGVGITTKIVVGSFGSEIYSMTETITNVPASTSVASAVHYLTTNTDVITVVYTVTAAYTSSLPVSLVTGLCYVSEQDALTPCTSNVLASSTTSSPAIQLGPNGLFKALSLKHPAVGANQLQKRATTCGGWQAAIIVTSIVIAVTLVSIVVVAAILKDKKEDWPLWWTYRWGVYGGQILLVGLLAWVVVWAAMKTVGNGCN